MTDLPDLSAPPLDDRRYLVLLACGHWEQSHATDTAPRRCPQGHLTRPAYTVDGWPAILASWDLHAAEATE